MKNPGSREVRSALLNPGDILRSDYPICEARSFKNPVGHFNTSDRALKDTAWHQASRRHCLNEAVDRKGEVIMLAANTGTLDKALQVVQVNDKRLSLSLLGGDDVYTPKTLQIAGEAAEDVVLAIPWHIKSSLDRKFASTARQLWGEDVNWRTATAYDAAKP